MSRSIKAAVAPVLDDPEAGTITGVASSGDTTFSVDVAAEKALHKAAESFGTPLACYSEDEGLITFGSEPVWLLIVDPIDGTRPAAAGLDSCVVSVAVAYMNEDARFFDVAAGAVYELRRDRLYGASRGGGAFVIENGQQQSLQPRPPADISELRWTLEVVARPSRLNFLAAGRLIDATSLRGGFFVLNSSAYTICQIAAGRMSGMVDLSGRLLKELDPHGNRFRHYGHGKIMGLWAYDIAAAALIALEAGCTITDAWGRPLDTMPLTKTRPRDMASCICAASAEHHEQMLQRLEEGIHACHDQELLP